MTESETSPPELANDVGIYEFTIYILGALLVWFGFASLGDVISIKLLPHFSDSLSANVLWGVVGLALLNRGDIARFWALFSLGLYLLLFVMGLVFEDYEILDQESSLFSLVDIRSAIAAMLGIVAIRSKKGSSWFLQKKREPWLVMALSFSFAIASLGSGIVYSSQIAKQSELVKSIYQFQVEIQTLDAKTKEPVVFPDCRLIFADDPLNRHGGTRSSHDGTSTVYGLASAPFTVLIEKEGYESAQLYVTSLTSQASRTVEMVPIENPGEPEGQP